MVPMSTCLWAVKSANKGLGISWRIRKGGMGQIDVCRWLGMLTVGLGELSKNS
jgi:hypothetical protein